MNNKDKKIWNNVSTCNDTKAASNVVLAQSLHARHGVVIYRYASCHTEWWYDNYMRLMSTKNGSWSDHRIYDVKIVLYL
jgi:hypothetical protein